MNKVFVVAAHPDDEILGIGATAAKHVSLGDEVYCLILGEGQTSRWESQKDGDSAIVESLHKDTLNAAKVIGYQQVFFADFPDNRFDQVDLLDIVKVIERYVQEIRPDIIYTHCGCDLNIDHQRTFQAVMTGTRTVGNYSVKELYTFETLSSTEWNFDRAVVFQPNVYSDIELWIDIKIRAMKEYKSELCQYPHPRSIEGIKALAQYRGMTVGKKYVEAFELIRQVR